MQDQTLHCRNIDKNFTIMLQKKALFIAYIAVEGMVKCLRREGGRELQRFFLPDARGAGKEWQRQ